MHYFCSSFLDGRSVRERIESNRFRGLYHVKYYVLAALLVMAAGHSLQIGWLDPIAFLTRGFAVFVQPGSQLLRSALPGGGMRGMAVLVLSPVAGFAFGWMVSRILRGKGSGTRSRRASLVDALMAALVLSAAGALARFSPVAQRSFHWGLWIAGAFLAALALNRAIPHFWCRVLCPLGALLGVLGKFSLWQIHRDPRACTGCGRCVEKCAGACDPDTLLRKSECVLCMNCRDVCPERCISYGFLPPVGRERRPSPDLERRRFVGALGVGALWVAGVRIGADNRRTGVRDRIRPPGSVDEAEFLSRCIKCGACMKVCPTNVIQPALAEGGFEGLWSPILIFRVGHCEYDCVLCGQVCPTGAIRRFSRDEKTGRGKWQDRPIRIGTAFIDRGRCLPWSVDTPCVVCQEVCPVSPKAIYTKSSEAARRDGSKVVLGQPYVDPVLCTGCGICEKECPVQDYRAIRVSSVGETRSSANQMLLGGPRKPRG
jgi:ferredoxin